MYKGELSFYLAHPLVMQKEIREWELDFEKRTGINLDNPFYDHGMLRKGKNVSVQDLEFHPAKSREEGLWVVEKDLKAIEDANGTIAFVEYSKESLGTPAEFFYSSYILNKPTYVVSKTANKHIWIKGLATKIFTSEKDLEKYLIENY